MEVVATLIAPTPTLDSQSQAAAEGFQRQLAKAQEAEPKTQDSRQPNGKEAVSEEQKAPSQKPDSSQKPKSQDAAQSASASAVAVALAASQAAPQPDLGGKDPASGATGIQPAALMEAGTKDANPDPIVTKAPISIDPAITSVPVQPDTNPVAFGLTAVQAATVGLKSAKLEPSTPIDKTAQDVVVSPKNPKVQDAAQNVAESLPPRSATEPPKEAQGRPVNGTENAQGSGSGSDSAPIRPVQNASLGDSGASDSGGQTGGRSEKHSEPSASDASKLVTATGRTTTDSGTQAVASSKNTSATSNADQKLQVVRQVADRIELLAAAKPKGGVSVHLEPPDLGQVTITVKSNGNQIEASLSASNEALRQTLDGGKAQLIDQLQTRGLQVVNLQVGAQQVQKSGVQETARSTGHFTNAGNQGMSQSAGRQDAELRQQQEARKTATRGFDLDI